MGTRPSDKVILFQDRIGREIWPSRRKHIMFRDFSRWVGARRELVTRVFSCSAGHRTPADHFTPKVITPEYESGLEYLRTILYYVTRTSDRSERQLIIDMVKAQGTTGDQLMTTIYQEILEEGIEQGMTQLILRLLKKYDAQTVSQMTELPLETILEVEKDQNSR